MSSEIAQIEWTPRRTVNVILFEKRNSERKVKRSIIKK